MWRGGLVRAVHGAGRAHHALGRHHLRHLVGVGRLERLVLQGLHRVGLAASVRQIRVGLRHVGRPGGVGVRHLLGGGLRVVRGLALEVADGRIVVEVIASHALELVDLRHVVPVLLEVHAIVLAVDGGRAKAHPLGDAEDGCDSRHHEVGHDEAPLDGAALVGVVGPFERAVGQLLLRAELVAENRPRRDEGPLHTEVLVDASLVHVDDAEDGEERGAEAPARGGDPAAVHDVAEDGAPEEGDEHRAVLEAVDAPLLEAGAVDAHVERSGGDPVADGGEEAEEEDAPVPLGEGADGILADHEADEEDDGPDGDGGEDGLEDHEDPRHAHDEVNEAVDPRVASGRAVALVRGVPDVDDGAERRAEDGGDNGAKAVGNHGLVDGVGVAGVAGREEAHEGEGRGGDGEGDDHAEVRAEKLESLAQLDDGDGRGDEAVDDVTRVHDACVEARGEVTALAAGHGVDPGDDGADEDDAEGLGEEAKDFDVGVPPDEDEEDGEEARDGRAEVGRDLADTEEGEADARDRHEERRGGEHLHEPRPEEAQADVDDADNEVGGDGDAIALAEAILLDLGVVREARGGPLGDVHRDHDVEHPREGGGGVEAVGLGGELPAGDTGHAGGLVRVVYVAEHHRNPDAARDFAIHDEVEVIRLDEEVAVGPKVAVQRQQHADKGAQIVEEELRERAPFLPPVGEQGLGAAQEV
mmetsp:Transcript_38456/g.94577  ORF Transcript_38456/g.94577 Transcript_38456/m.94577 type:complete len:698 (+) Transcript_38456:224-2317(+)|eukprot:CAMPEP_0206228672 /NCGR_PEP_ID=MMETSP0047_2-20121206/9292_1 /ASSEMBLY_ACC=CAM_ASM_000192 /TAXON_ID=195065 /ORGANISM="Chroomonas mesostigmatica_cf, Strain CCMP1168" /LENGTH=697 /DNA_ID=CAMNT_0053651927 /DNA_START=278 /DNA_END=2371 /DNA_ORIENTATION=+